MKSLFAVCAWLIPALVFAVPETASREPLNLEPQVVERASADHAVEVPHKSTGQKIAEALRAQGLSKDAVVVALLIVSAGDFVAVIVAVTGLDVTVPSVAVAELVTEPVSISACVMAYVAVHVTAAPGARPEGGKAGHVTTAILLSLTLMDAVEGTEMLPVLVTR